MSEQQSRASRAAWVALVAGTVVLVGLDQLTKRMAEAELPGRGIVRVVEGFFQLRFARNPGAFFSMGAQLSPGARQVLFGVAALIAFALILRLYHRTESSQRSVRAALVALFSGAIGNLIDRLWRGEVTDFLHLHWKNDFHWATFNLADVWIVVGLLLLVVDVLGSARESEPPNAASPPSYEDSAESS